MSRSNRVLDLRVAAAAGSVRRRRTVPLRLAEIQQLPPHCRSCVFWELDDEAAARVRAGGDTALEKEAWLSAVLLEQSAAGRLALIEREAVGHLLWAPPSQVPRSSRFPSSPVSPDAVVLTSLEVAAEHRREGVARLLVQAAVADLARSGVRAVEAFAWAGAEPVACLVPASFLLSVGFREVRRDPRVPRLRLDVTTAVAARSRAEARVDAWREMLRAGSRRRPAAPAPVKEPTAPTPVPVARGWSAGTAVGDDAAQPASSDSLIIPVGASASAGR